MESRMDRRMSKELTEIAKEVKTLQDMKTLDDFDLGNVELIRGETPVDIKAKCLQLCKDYLSENWLNQTIDTIEVNRITGGLTNQLYSCEIINKLNDTDIPQKVAIRLYGLKHFNADTNDGNQRFTDVVTALMVSENRLGPKVYGLFEEGQILKFYKHRQFRVNEQNNPKLSEQVFKMLARVHSMNVPIKRSKNWVFECFDNFYSEGFKIFPINQLIDELNCETMKKHDLKDEIIWLKKVIEKTNSPRVFSHTDLRGSNIMVTEPEEEIVLCDFEFSSYAHRGYDFGTLIVEWDHDLSEFGKNIEKFPNDSTIITLIKHYIKEMEKIFGERYSQNAINSVEHILKEVKVFSLAALMFMILFCIKNDEKAEQGFPVIKSVMMQWSDECYRNYHILKEKLEKIFED